MPYLPLPIRTRGSSHTMCSVMVRERRSGSGASGGSPTSAAGATAVFLFLLCALSYKHQELKRLFAIPKEHMVRGDNPLYVCVVQEDGHMAWSSPIYAVV